MEFTGGESLYYVGEPAENGHIAKCIEKTYTIIVNRVRGGNKIIHIN
jgi:hypothetical protein